MAIDEQSNSEAKTQAQGEENNAEEKEDVANIIKSTANTNSIDGELKVGSLKTEEIIDANSNLEELMKESIKMKKNIYEEPTIKSNSNEENDRMEENIDLNHSSVEEVTLNSEPNVEEVNKESTKTEEHVVNHSLEEPTSKYGCNDGTSKKENDKIEETINITQGSAESIESEQDNKIDITDHLTAEELRLYYKNLRLEDNSIPDEERKALLQKVSVKDGSLKDVFSTFLYNNKWYYICHPCEKSYMNWNIFNLHIHEMCHDERLKFPEESVQRFEVSLIQGISGKMLVAGNTNKIKDTKARFRKKTVNFDEPLIGLEYLIEIVRPQKIIPHSFICLLCETEGDFETILSHVSSVGHYWTCLAKFFPTAEQKLIDLKNKCVINSEQQDLLIKHLAARIEYVYGRLKPLLVDSLIFPRSKWVIFEMIETQSKHIRELPERDFTECVDIGHLEPGRCPVGWIRRNKEQSVGGVPMIQVPPNFDSFIFSPKGRRKELPFRNMQTKVEQLSNKLPLTMQKNNESARKFISKSSNTNWRFPGRKFWKLIQNPKLLFLSEGSDKTTEIRNEKAETNDNDVKPMINQGNSKEQTKGIYYENTPRSSSKKDNQLPSGPIDSHLAQYMNYRDPQRITPSKQANHKAKIYPNKRFHSQKLPTTSNPYYPKRKMKDGGPRNNYLSTNRQNKTDIVSSLQLQLKNSTSLYGSFIRPETFAARSYYPYQPLQNNTIESGTVQNRSIDEARSYNSAWPNQKIIGRPHQFQSTSLKRTFNISSQDDNSLSQHYSIKQLKMSCEEPNVTKYTANCDVITVLRHLSVLESFLGSLGSQVVTLLSEALYLEKSSKGGADILISREEIFLETIKEKLIGLLEVGLLDKTISGVATSVVQKINSLFSGQKSNKRYEHEKPSYSGKPMSGSESFVENTRGISLALSEVPLYIKNHKSVTNLSSEEKDKISQKIAQFLYLRNISRISKYKLEQHINDYVKSFNLPPKKHLLGQSSSNYTLNHLNYFNNNSSISKDFGTISNNYNQLSKSLNNSDEGQIWPKTRKGISSTISSECYDNYIVHRKL